MESRPRGRGPDAAICCHVRDGAPARRSAPTFTPTLCCGRSRLREAVAKLERVSQYIRVHLRTERLDTRHSVIGKRKPPICSGFMGLGGLEPPTSWVRFRRQPSPLFADLRRCCRFAARAVWRFASARTGSSWVLDQKLDHPPHSRTEHRALPSGCELSRRSASVGVANAESIKVFSRRARSSRTVTRSHRRWLRSAACRLRSRQRPRRRR